MRYIRIWVYVVRMAGCACVILLCVDFVYERVWVHAFVCLCCVFMCVSVYIMCQFISLLRIKVFIFFLCYVTAVTLKYDGQLGMHMHH